jgi:hypothetical protein
MQQKVIERALMGFGMTNYGAANGDGPADSTHDARRGRHFLESRWGHALIIEHIEATDPGFSLRVRGRFAPIVCEFDGHREYPDCVTLPAPVAAPVNVRASISGRLALPEDARALSRGAVVHLLPLPVPARTAFDSLCAAQDSAFEPIAASLERRLEAAKSKEAYEAVEKDVERIINNAIGPARDAWFQLFARYAIRHAPVEPDGRFAFSTVPSGNYILFAGFIADQRIEWFVPVTVRSEAPLVRDLDSTTMSRQEWGCGTPLPFAAVRSAR